MNRKLLQGSTSIMKILIITCMFIHGASLYAQLNPSIKIKNFHITYSDTIEKPTVKAMLSFELTNPDVSRIIKISLFNKQNKQVIFKNTLIIKSDQGSYSYTSQGKEFIPLVNNKIVTEAIVPKLPLKEIGVQIMLCKQDDHLLNIFLQ